MRKTILLATGLILALGLASAAAADPLTLTGNYAQVGISDYGTFGSDGNTEPGILLDPTGKQNFYPGGVPNDVLTPGNPHDGFAINSDQTGFQVNDNNGDYSAFGTSSPTLLTGAAAHGYQNAATWSGSYDGVNVTNSYYFNLNSTSILITSAITNDTGSALTDLYFGRSEDPDPDVYLYGQYDTVNTFGDDNTAPNNLVTGSGADTGLTIGIYNGSSYAANTEISYGCCENDDPALVYNGTGDGYSPTDIVALTGSNSTYADEGLQMAWKIGTLGAGDTAVVDYYYVFGATQATVTSTAPEPASWALLFAGIGALGMLLRRQKKTTGDLLAAAV